MSDITEQTPQIRQISPTERRANALSELQQLHADYAALQQRTEEDGRNIHRLEDRNGLLLDELRTSRQNERVVTRKLMRLASAMSNIGHLSREAEEIMASAKEFLDDETAAEAEVERPAIANQQDQ